MPICLRNHEANCFGGDQWERIKDFLSGKASDSGVTAGNNRLFIEAVLWIARTGSPWRDLPESFGHWHRVYVRYNRRPHKGTWAKVLVAVASGPDLEYLLVDGSIVRVHQHGAAKKQQNDEAMGLPRGGLSTKIHVAADALGNPVRLLLTAGQTSEYSQAEALIAGAGPGGTAAGQCRRQLRHLRRYSIPVTRQKPSGGVKRLHPTFGRARLSEAFGTSD